LDTALSQNNNKKKPGNLRIQWKIFFSMFFEESVKLPTPYETLGCVLMFFAIILSQLPEKKKAITSDVE
jgi:hypothetical protein